MKPLDRLDFLQRRPTPWAGWAVAALGLAVLTWTALPLWSLQQDNLLRQQRLERLSAAAPTGTASAATVAAPRRDDSRSNELVQRLNAPWGELFALLEQHASPDIGLLQVEPDALTRQVRITALSRDLPGMVAWLRQLQADARLMDVLLLQHQREEQTPGQPVRFSVSARWQALPPRALPPATAPSAASTAESLAQGPRPAATAGAPAPVSSPVPIPTPALPTLPVALPPEPQLAGLDLARSQGGPR